MSRRAELQFNAQVGNRIGRPITAARHQFRNQPRTTNRSRVGRIQRGSPTVPSRVVSNYRRQSGQPGTRSSRGGTPRQDPLMAIYTDLTNKFVTNANEQQAIEAANEDKENDRPWYSDVWNAVGGGLGLIDNGTGFAGSIIGRSLDAYGRPAYGVAAGLLNAAQHHDFTGAQFAPQDVVRFAQDFPKGFSGEQRTGFGEIYEAGKNSIAGEALRDLEEAHPAIEQGIAIGAGALGELALDPTNVVSFGLPSIVRQGLLNEGRNATEAVLRETTQNVAEEAVQHSLQSSVLQGTNSLIRNNPQIFADRMLNTLGDSFDRAVLSVHGGGRRGAVRLLNRPGWAQEVATQVGNEARRAFRQPFEMQVNSLWDNAAHMTAQDALDMAQHSRSFDDFFREIGDELINSGKLPVNASIDDVLHAIDQKLIPEAKFREISRNFTDAIDIEIQPMVDRALAETSNQTQRSIGLRLGKRDYPVVPVGRAFGWLGSKLDTGIFPSLHTVLNDSVFEQTFGGLFSLKTGRARALGIKGFEVFKDDLKTFARNYTADQGRILAKAVETAGASFTDPHMQQALDWLRARNRALFGDETGIGARNFNDVPHDAFGYVHLRGGSNKARRAFRQGRSEAYKLHGNPGEWTIEKAKQMGLRPEQNAFENLLQKYIVSRKNMTQAFFRDDLVRSYGTQIADLSDNVARASKLKAVDPTTLATNWRRQLAQMPNSKMYIPEEMSNIAEHFEAMSNWSPAEWGRVGRQWANVISKMKLALTLPFVGFHNRNFIGDVFMGLLDGVNPHAYEEMTRVWLHEAAHGAGTGTLHILKGNKILDMSLEDLKKLYKENVDTGFIRTEAGTYASATAGNVARNMGRRVVTTATNIADKRELFPRYTHFYAAYKEEAQALWNRGWRDTAKIKRRATDAAMWRVNGYKFDYSALMPWEQSLKTAVFPFYTYLRKAIPTLMENMYVNPHYFSTLNRFMEHNDGSAADVFNKDNIPKWIRDIGFATMGKGSEPWAITADVLPMGAMDILGSQGGAEFAQNIIQNMNPLLQMPFELASGHDAFTGAPINTDILPYLGQNAPLVGDIVEEFTNPLDKPWAERLLTDRLLGAGISARHVTAEQQLFTQNQRRDEAIDKPLQNYNHSQDTYYIAVTDEFTYRINNKYTGETMGEYRTPTAAIRAAQALPAGNNSRPFISPYEQPTMADAVMAQSQGYHPYPQ